MRGSYSLQQIDISFTSGENQLSGIIVKPVTDKLSNAIVLVHGSGPVDRDSHGSFVALRERFARLGYVVLCYDKPGVGESTGDWRKQTFEDRAREVLSAIRFIKTHPLQIQGVGLCGGSQAGWIMPIVAQLTEPVAFIISISSAAVTVEEQERYRIGRQLRGDHFSDEQVSQALSIYARRLDMIRQGAKVKQITAMQDSAMEEPWFPYLGDTTAEDLRFFIGVYRFNPVPFLKKVHCPFLGIWGALDTYVPVERSMELTRQALKDAGNTCFELKLLPGTNHGMRLAETSGLNERTTEFAPKFWETLTQWLCERS